MTKAKFRILAVAGLVVVLGLIALVKALQIKTLMSMKGAPVPESVATAVARSEDWQEAITSVGSLSAVQGVTVSAELDGKIVEVAFEAGSMVKAGDLLVRQDTSQEEAQLRSAEAAVDLARITLERTTELFAKETLSHSQFDSDTAAAKQAAAFADNIRATISKKTIRAPFSGKLGIRLVNLGQNLKAGDAIVSLQALDPIFVDFYLPQENLPRISAGLAVHLTGDALPVKAIEGKITAISPDVDASTRNVRVQATVKNSDGYLHPGMYVDVAVELPITDKVLIIPATAIVYAPYGNTVYIVDEKTDEATGAKQLVVRQQIVRLGIREGDFVAVTSGLKEGDTIVTSGVFRLRPGSVVSVNNSLSPAAETTPKPADS